jgi:hypothetical protein
MITSSNRLLNKSQPAQHTEASYQYAAGSSDFLSKLAKLEESSASPRLTWKSVKLMLRPLAKFRFRLSTHVALVSIDEPQLQNWLKREYAHINVAALETNWIIFGKHRSGYSLTPVEPALEKLLHLLERSVTFAELEALTDLVNFQAHLSQLICSQVADIAD